MDTNPGSLAHRDHGQFDDATIFDFDITLETHGAVFQRDHFVVINFSLSHSHTHPIKISSDPPSELQLGFRLLPPKSDTILFEDRIRIDADIDPAVSTLHALRIPAHFLVAGSQYNLLIDFLLERRYWFHQRNIKPFNQILEFTPSTAGSPARQSPFDAGQEGSDITRLTYNNDSFSTFLEFFDFSDYSAIDVIINENNSRGAIPGSLLEALNSPFREDSQIDQICSITELMAHFSARNSHNFEKLSGTRNGRFQIIRDFALFSRNISSNPSEFFPKPLLDFLNAPAFDDGVFKIPMSRIMLWYWLEENRALRPDMMSEREEIYWWWTTSVMPSRGLPAAMIPMQALSYFSYPHDAFANRVVTLSRFAYRAFQTSDALMRKYNLNNDCDLIAYSFDFLIHNITNEINISFVGNSLKDFWAFIDKSTGRTRFEVAMVANYARKANPAENKTPSDVLHLIRNNVGAHDESLVGLTRSDKGADTQGEDTSASARIVVAGLAGSRSGLGVNMSMSTATFRHLETPADEYDVVSRSFRRDPGRKRFDAALFHVNADAVGDAILYDKSRRLSNSYRIGFYLWELDKLPRTHRLGCVAVDEIWAPSEFLRDLYSQASNKPVINVKKYVMMSNVTSLMRATDAAHFKFLASFDFHSGVERKNPIAIVRAFQRAFPSHVKDVQLTIKTTEFVPDHWGDANGQWLLVKQACAADPRLCLIENAMSEREYFSLISGHDCVVSAHRAEGFGYLPAYAMSLGIPVIVTDYSGTKDFCSTETSFPVSYRLIEVRTGEFITDVPGARWADIDVDELAATMQIVRAGGTEVADRAKRGQQLMRAEYSLEAHAQRYKRILSDRGIFL